MRQLYKSPVIFLLLGALAILLFLPSVNNPFMWDDERQIVQNSIFRNPGGLSIILTNSTFDFGGNLDGAFYRPVFSLVNYLNFKLWGLHPAGFHIIQFLLHAVVVVLSYIFLKRLLKAEKIKNNVLPFFIVGLFMLHPALVESVSYIAAIGEILYSLMIISSLLLLTSNVTFLKKVSFFSLIGFCSLFIKESAIIIWPLGLSYLVFYENIPVKKLLAFITSGTFFTSLYLYIRLFVAHIPIGAFYGTGISEATLTERILTFPYIVSTYMANTLFPINLAIYQNTVITSTLDYRFYIYLPLIIFVILGLIYLVLLSPYKRLLLFLMTWILIGYAPVSNIITGLNMTTADRWMYLPLIASIAFVCVLLYPYILKLIQQKPQLKIVLILTLILYIGFLLTTQIERQRHWSSPIKLYGHDLMLLPDSSELNNQYGRALLFENRYYEAITYLKHAVSLKPHDIVPNSNLAAAYLVTGDLQKALDQNLYIITSIRNPYLYTAYANTVFILIKMNRLEEAQIVLDEGIQIFPNYDRLKTLQALIYIQNNDREAAEKVLRELFSKEVIESDVAEFLDIIDYDFETEFLRAPGT